MKLVYPQANESIPAVVDVPEPQSAPATTEPVQRDPSPDVFGRPKLAERDIARSNRSKGKYKPPRPRSPSPPPSPSPPDEERVDIDFEGLEKIDDVDDWIDDDGPESIRRECPDTPSLSVVEHLGGEGDDSRFLLADGRRVSRYELYRLRNIAKNKQLMERLGIPEAANFSLHPKR